MIYVGNSSNGFVNDLCPDLLGASHFELSFGKLTTQNLNMSTQDVEKRFTVNSSKTYAMPYGIRKHADGVAGVSNDPSRLGSHGSRRLCQGPQFYSCGYCFVNQAMKIYVLMLLYVYTNMI